MPWSRKCRLSARHARLGVVKDRRGERGVGAAGREHVDEMRRAPPAPPEAITGIDTAAETAAVSAQSKPAFVPSRSIDVSRISPAPRAFGLARPLDGVAIGGRLAAARVDGEADRRRAFASMATTTAWLP